MKRWHVTAKFPQALAKNTFQSVSVEAAGIHTAASRALDLLLDRDGIKGLRHKQVVITIQRDLAAPAESA